MEYSRGFGTANWLDQRTASAKYEDSSPEVLVVGGGQGGLALAARLTQMGIDTLIVDRHERIGDNWRKRYHSLTLHNVVWTNHLPYLSFPSTWPVYIPKDMLANWFEFYADAMELNIWTGTEFRGGTYDAQRECWTVQVNRADGSERTLHPNHVVIATGVSGNPKMPSISGLSDFGGTIVHSSAFKDGRPFRGCRAIVIGTGTSGHDAAHDLYSSGAEVTMVQRGATTVLSLEPTAVSFYALYTEDRPTSWSDLITLSFPYDLIIASARRLTEAGTKNDAALLTALHEVGFRTDVGEDGTGWQLKYLRYGGGYYFNVGCSELIADEKIHLRQFGEIEYFTATGVHFNDGSDLPLDLVVLATGYEPLENSVAALFGNEVAGRVGKVWGFDEGGEMSNVWRPTSQPGLWFTLGSLAQARIYSKYLAMQIWAQEQGRDQTGRFAKSTGGGHGSSFVERLTDKVR
jgi:cation diffusion facilitator CzcD-associated flavoprotein CzcO